MTAFVIARIALCALLALVLSATGGGKLAGAASSRAIRDSLHIGATPWRAIGVFELIVAAMLVVGIWVPVGGVLGASGVVVLMIGAIVARVRAGGAQRRTGVPADLVVGVIAVVAVIVAAVSA